VARLHPVRKRAPAAAQTAAIVTLNDVCAAPPPQSVSGQRDTPDTSRAPTQRRRPRGGRVEARPAGARPSGAQVGWPTCTSVQCSDGTSDADQFSLEIGLASRLTRRAPNARHNWLLAGALCRLVASSRRSNHAAAASGAGGSLRAVVSVPCLSARPIGGSRSRSVSRAGFRGDAVRMPTAGRKRPAPGKISLPRAS
jgi:hypothetical protein